VDGKVGGRLSRLSIPEVLPMKFPVTAGALLLAGVGDIGLWRRRRA
jgi:hypothetical protein